jgi:hypothetical protein
MQEVSAVELKAAHPVYLVYPMLDTSMEVKARNIPVLWWTTLSLALTNPNRINLM